MLKTNSEETTDIYAENREKELMEDPELQEFLGFIKRTKKKTTQKIYRSGLRKFREWSGTSYAAMLEDRERRVRQNGQKDFWSSENTRMFLAPETNKPPAVITATITRNGSSHQTLAGVSVTRNHNRLCQLGIIVGKTSDRKERYEKESDRW